MSGRKLAWCVPAVIVLCGVFAGLVPGRDQLPIRRMLASGDGLQVTRGTIDQTWHIVDRRRDDNSSIRNSYRTVVSEGFDIGAERFSWVLGGCLSPPHPCASWRAASRRPSAAARSR
jgi:hypothetical protein